MGRGENIPPKTQPQIALVLACIVRAISSTRRSKPIERSCGRLINGFLDAYCCGVECCREVSLPVLG